MALNKMVQVGVQKNSLGEVIAVFDLRTLTKEQVDNLKTQALENKAREESKKADLQKKIESLESELAKVKGELAYNRGEISREEYEELCGLNK